MPILTERLPKAGEAYRVPFAKISCSAGASSDCLWQGAQIDAANIEPLAADHLLHSERDDGGYNESLSVEHDTQQLYLKPLGMSSRCCARLDQLDRSRSGAHIARALSASITRAGIW